MDNKEFLHYVNSQDKYDAFSAPADLRNVIQKEIPLGEIYPILSAAKQKTLKIKEIVLESEIDFVKSAKQLKQVFDEQLDSAIDKVNTAYERELLQMQSAFRKQYFGTQLLEMIDMLNDNDYTLVMMHKRIYAYKCYNPAHDVTVGRFTSGIDYDFDEPVCTLKGVYVNLLHPKMTNGTIFITTEGRHPNASNSGFSEVCIGDMENRAVPVNDPQALVELLDDICEMYEVCHLDSAYFIPEQSYTTKQNESHKWTA